MYFAVDFSSYVSGNGMRKIREDSQFSSMLQQVYRNEKYAEYDDLAMTVAYQVFWHSGERQSFCWYI
jgi:hypothetical protein